MVLLLSSMLPAAWGQSLSFLSELLAGVDVDGLMLLGAAGWLASSYVFRVG